MIREGVIERLPLGVVFSYISPAHWVPKDVPETKFSLMTPIRLLNEAVESEVLTFPTLASVMTQNYPAIPVFIVSDLASSNHQLKIPKRDQHLLRFLLEDREYLYARQPMGFIDSGHRFINVVNRFLAEFKITMEVNSMLIGGHPIEKAVERFGKFLLGCRKYNIKLARRKLQCGPIVNFCMRLGGVGGYKPSPAKSEAIRMDES